MKKLLRLLGVLTICGTGTTTVVACDNIPNVNHKSWNNWDKLISVMADGSIFNNKDNEKLDTQGRIDALKTALVLRIQSHETNYQDLKTTSFKLDLALGNKKLVNQDTIIAGQDKNFKNSVNQSQQFKFTMTLNENSKVLEFKNFIFIKLATPMDMKKDILDVYTNITRPIHIFSIPKDITIDNFKEIFWNGVLGEPNDFNSQKSYWEIKINQTDVKKLNNLVPHQSSVTPTTNNSAKIHVKVNISQEFTTAQEGYILSPGEYSVDVYFTAISN